MVASCRVKSMMFFELVLVWMRFQSWSISAVMPGAAVWPAPRLSSTWIGVSDSSSSRRSSSISDATVTVPWRGVPSAPRAR